MNKRTGLTMAGAGLVLSIAAGGIAYAAENHDEDHGDRPVTSAQEASAKQAALDAAKGGKVTSVTTEDHKGAAYEVEVTETNGKRVEVVLDKTFKTVSVQAAEREGADDAEQPKDSDD